MKCTRPHCNGDIVGGEGGSYCLLCNRLVQENKADIITCALTYGVVTTEAKYKIPFGNLVNMLENWLADKDKRHLCRLHGKVFRMQDRLPDILRLPF
jgi:hypothetical protein